MHNIQQCDPHVLESIMDRYRQRNKALEERESAIIKILANIDREKSSTSEIECKIRTAISDSKSLEHDVGLRPGRWSTHNNVRRDTSDFYPRLSGRADSFTPLPSIQDESVQLELFDRAHDLDSEHSSSRNFPQQDVHRSSKRELNYSYTRAEHGSSLDTFENTYDGAFMSDTSKDCVRAASPEDRSRRGGCSSSVFQHTREAMRSDADIERLLRLTDPDVACDAKDSVSDVFTDTLDSILPKGTFTDNEKQPCREQKEDMSEFMKHLISPSIHEMIQNYEQRHTGRLANDDYKRNKDCDTRSSRRIVFENSRPVTSHQDQRGPVVRPTTSISWRMNTTSSTSPVYSTSLGRPFSDSERDTSSESIRSAVSQRTRSNLNSKHLASFDCSRKVSRSDYSLHDRQDSHSQQSSVNNVLDLSDIESEPYEFEENYSNNYLAFMIRNCLPKSLLKSEYNSSYNWSIENKQDIFNKIEEIELIKKVICEELDYRQFINKPFKLHRNDRRFLLRNIMHAEAVKRGLSKGLPICAVMALFAETGSTENIKHLTLQLIRQANEILDESHPDPDGVENIVSAAEKCVHKLTVLDKKTSAMNSRKLCKILQDIISREPILDPCDNLRKCIDELKNLHVDDDKQEFDEVDSLLTEVCRLKNIVWSVEEHAALKACRESSQEGTSRNSVGSKQGPVSHITRDDLTKQQVRLVREVGRMKRRIRDLENDAIPRAISRKKEDARITARNNSLTNERLPSCHSYKNTNCPTKSLEPVHNRQCDKKTSSIGPSETSVPGVTPQTGSDATAKEKEQESLKNEVDRLRFLVENMERRMEHGNESGDIATKHVDDLKTSSANISACKANLRHVAVPANTCSSTRTVHKPGCALETNKNAGHVHKRVVYLVANKGEQASDVVKHCIQQNSPIPFKIDKTPSAVSDPTEIQETRRTVIPALPLNTEKESDQSKQEQIETMETNNDSVYTARATEKTVTSYENINDSTSRNLPVIPEKSDVFVSALSLPFAPHSSDVSECTSLNVDDQSTCRSKETEANKTISKRRNTNSAESMWKNMVDALIPGNASKRRQNAGAGSGSKEAESSSDFSSNPKEDDQCSNKQTEKPFFKIIHKNGSAYEISSTALNEDDPTQYSSSGDECKPGLADDFSRHLALAVKMCNGPEAAAESLKEAFRESYVATCEKAINDALKDIINSCPLGNGYCDGQATQITKSKKRSKRRSGEIGLDDTILSDCGTHYTKDDVVIVGTTKMNNGRYPANNPRLRKVVPNSSNKKQKALAALKEEHCINVSYEPISTTLTVVDSDHRMESQSTSMIGQEYRSIVREAIPNDQSSSTTRKGLASSRTQSRSSPKTKTAKTPLTFRGRRIGNKGESSNGNNAAKKKNIIAGKNKATKRPASPIKRTSNDGNKMGLCDKVANYPSSGHKNAKSARFKQGNSVENCINNGRRTTKALSETQDVNSEVSILFDGADRMDEKESNENAVVFDAEEAAVVGDQTEDKISEMDCSSALDTVSGFELGREYKRAMIHVKNCPSCTKKLLPTLLQVVNKVEDMTKKCENPDPSKSYPLKGTKAQGTQRPRPLTARGKSR